MTMDHSHLANKYSAMSDEEFELIIRADLADWAKPYYDREKTRRLPGWRYEAPTPEAKLIELLQIQKRLLRKQKHNVIARVILILCGYAFAIFAIPADRSDIKIYLSALLILSIMTLVSYRIACKTGSPILWLRRFHKRQHHSFQKILEEACVMVGVPITIQDSSFRFSMGMVQVRIGSVASFGVMVLLLAGFLPVGRIGVDLVGLIFFGVIGLAALFSRKLGCTKLHQANAEEQTLQLLADVRGRKKSRGGVMILKCEDSFWRESYRLQFNMQMQLS